MVFERLFDAEVFGVGEGVPAPFAVGAERKPVLAVFGEGLQPRGVKRQGKAAVAQVQGMERRERIDVRVVAGDQRFTVDPGRRACQTAYRQQQNAKLFHWVLWVRI